MKKFSMLQLVKQQDYFNWKVLEWEIQSNNETNKFDDIIALVALHGLRPKSNIPIYNDCKNGIKEPDYIHPILKEILKPTYGIIIYQEQVRIAQTLAGFTAGEADVLRRAMGKRKSRVR